MPLTHLEGVALELAPLPVTVQYGIVAIYGVIFGGFLAVVVHRLPIMWKRQREQQARLAQRVPLSRYNLWAPRSACPACQNALKLWQSIPVFGYLALRGRCGFCGARISARYLLLELSTGALSIGVVWRFGWTWHALAAFMLASFLLTVAAISARKVGSIAAQRGRGLSRKRVTRGGA
ncbi:prepilin peptidase [Burkholderia anthina]|uniref:prepilin peptidase n=1 Tax=Burkholderia anthina TaxID=179879 RepID=UPI0009C13138